MLVRDLSLPAQYLSIGICLHMFVTHCCTTLLVQKHDGISPENIIHIYIPLQGNIYVNNNTYIKYLQSRPKYQREYSIETYNSPTLNFEWQWNLLFSVECCLFISRLWRHSDTYMSRWIQKRTKQATINIIWLISALLSKNPNTNSEFFFSFQGTAPDAKLCIKCGLTN